MLGSYAMDDARFDAWCPEFGCVGVSVEYRLAPETTYPGPLDDCYLGLKWVYDHHDEIGVDPGHIGIGGVSAGGGLAAGLALLARDRGEVPLRFQLLDCPMLDDRQTTPSSQLDGLHVWNRHSNTYGWRSYLGDLYGTEDVPPYAAASGHGPQRTPTGVHLCGRSRRIPRRGHPLRHPPQPGRRGGGPSRVLRRPPWGDDVRRLARGQALRGGNQRLGRPTTSAERKHDPEQRPAHLTLPDRHGASVGLDDAGHDGQA